MTFLPALLTHVTDQKMRPESKMTQGMNRDGALPTDELNWKKIVYVATTTNQNRNTVLYIPKQYNERAGCQRCFLRYPLDWFRRSTVAPNLDHEVYVPIPGQAKKSTTSKRANLFFILICWCSIDKTIPGVKHG
jgi:hypothetical protein